MRLLHRIEREVVRHFDGRESMCAERLRELQFLEICSRSETISATLLAIGLKIPAY